VKAIYHPEFPKDIKRFEAQYREVSKALAVRFRQAIDDAIQRLRASPGSVPPVPRLSFIVPKRRLWL